MKIWRWGVISTAKIAREKVVPGINKSPQCKVRAICSRREEHARAVADELDIPLAFGSYEDMLASDEIDIVYNPLPNHLHVPWSLKALAAGKHVLCEKPLALDLTEAEFFYTESQKYPQLKVMEAFMYQFHPQWQKAKELLQDGSLGEIKTIQCFFSYFNNDPQNVRNQADIGGGALMDIGCYPIALSRFLMGPQQVQRVSAQAEMDPNFHVDRIVSALVQYENYTCTFTCSTQCAPYQRVNIFGTRGRLEIEIPFNAPHNKPTRMWLQNEHGTEEIVLPASDQYTRQADVFVDAIRHNTVVPYSLSESVENMRTLQAIRDSF